MKDLPVTNPRSGQVDFHIRHFEAKDIAESANSLRKAQKNWESTGIDYRCQQLKLWANQIQLCSEEISEALCQDTGRRVFAHFEVKKVIELIEHWIDIAPKLLANQKEQQSAMIPSVKYHHKMVPYSLVGIISPWNVPLILALIDSIPALLAGSAVMLKPSEVTPRFSVPLAKTIEKIEGLNSVLNIVTGGADTGSAIINQVDTICFTGSVSTGRKVGVQAAQKFIPAFLELGGKDPAIVMASADLDNAANAIIRSAIGMTGQACQSLERVYVQTQVFDEFCRIITDKARKVKINYPDIGEGHIGPFIFAKQAEIVQQQMQDAIAKGAIIHCGGKIVRDGGCWCPPTVISNISQDMSLMNEETFGPIIPLIPFSSKEQAIEMANDSEFGLSAAVFAADRTEAEGIAGQIRAGAISVNDASLTAIVNDVEKNSFCMSGLGGSRMGAAGLTRFLRKRAIMYQSAPAATIDIFREEQMS